MSKTMSDAEKAFRASVDRRIDAYRMRPMVTTKMVCGECGRVFNMLDATEAAEWSAGHDCEV